MSSNDPVSPARAYELWQELIADEALFEATLDGSHASLAESRNLTPGDLVVLDEFSEAPGTRWNVENLRFRSALHVSAMLGMYLPVSVALLTENRPMWLQDIAFEYLAHHRWRGLGTELAEVERFAEYTRTRILKRRMVPDYFEEILDYEMAIVALRKSTRDLPRDEDVEVPTKLEGVVLGRGPAVITTEIPCTLEALAALQENPEPSGRLVSDDKKLVRSKTRLLGFVRNRLEAPRFIKLSEGIAIVLEACNGERTVDEVIEHLGRDYELEADAVLGLVRQLLELRILIPLES